MARHRAEVARPASRLRHRAETASPVSAPNPATLAPAQDHRPRPSLSAPGAIPIHTVPRVALEALAVRVAREVGADLGRLDRNLGALAHNPGEVSA